MTRRRLPICVPWDARARKLARGVHGMIGVRIAVIALTMAGAGSVPAHSAPDRSFSVSGAAFPVEPAPGLNQTSLGVRPAATRADLANPPSSSYGRAAAYDLGTIELYTGPPRPETVAECDTASPNIPDEATAAPGGMRLSAICSDRPAGDVSAAGGSYRGGGLSADDLSSRVVVDGGGDVRSAEATVHANAITLGPLVVSSVSTRASARAGGTPGSAVASGRVIASGATVDGVPVVIGADGIEVDKQRVPLEMVGTASQAVREALGQGGYADVRLVQPTTEAAPDGSRASVTGGGLMLFFNRNDPAQNYFIRITFGGVALHVALGGSFTGAGPDPSSPPPSSPGSSGVLGSTGTAGSGGSVAPVTPGSPAPPAGSDADRPMLTASRRTYDLPQPWRGWPVLIALAAAAAVAGWLTRRRLAGWWDANADRYLRG